MGRAGRRFDTTTGRQRPRQLGTYETRRQATTAARASLDGNAASRGTLAWLVHRYVESRTDVSVPTQAQYAWAARHIARGVGAIRLEHLDRADIHQWFAQLAASGRFG